MNVWILRRGVSAASLTLLLAAAVLAPRSGSCAEPAATLERQLSAAAPRIVRQLQERQCQNVGVLKFRVSCNGRDATDSAGTLNMFLAERLEAALALALTSGSEAPLRLARQASLNAAKIPGASHLSSKTCRKLFSRAYPPAWGEEPIELDAAITGVAAFARDNRSYTLGILVVRPDQPRAELLIPQLKVLTDAATLHEIDADFHVRSVNGQPELADPFAAAERVKQNPEQEFPLINDPSITLRIYYDGQPVELSFRDGQAWIPEPRDGQKVTMELQRLDSQDYALGVVLKVNGENTLYRERLRDADCAKWVLKPENPKGTIIGYSMPDGEHTEEFRIASREQSRGLEMYYGADVGTISLCVFAERRADEQPQYLTNLKSRSITGDSLAILQAKFPSDTPPDLVTLQQHLRSTAGGLVQKRGVIAPGEMVRQPLKYGEYDWHPEPMMSATIRYYRPDQESDVP